MRDGLALTVEDMSYFWLHLTFPAQAAFLKLRGKLPLLPRTFNLNILIAESPDPTAFKLPTNYVRGPIFRNILRLTRTLTH